MLTRKLPYFYEYVDSFNKLEQTNCPTISEFYSSLTEETISEDEYLFVKRIWNTFNIRNVREFMELYISVDTLILEDIMEAFRGMCIDYYRLDPFHFYSLPGLASESCPKMTENELDLMQDLDQYLMIEGSIRGGVSMIGHRYAKVNNRYLDDFDSSIPESYLLYFDINNLYGAAMSMSLPQGNFEFMYDDEIQKVDWLSLDPDGNFGYILEVDLLYPRELHHLHASMPLAPIRESIPYAELSPYYKNMLKEMGIKVKLSTGIKLFSTLKNKTNYVVYFKLCNFI